MFNIVEQKGLDNIEDHENNNPEYKQLWCVCVCACIIVFYFNLMRFYCHIVSVMLITLSFKSCKENWGKWLNWEETGQFAWKRNENIEEVEGGRGAAVLLYRHTILPYMLLLKPLCLLRQFLQGNTKTAMWVSEVNRTLICVCERETDR